MPPRDAAATRSRILAAAINEFAATGLAGGRVERIAREARTNVRMIYAYFGGKEGLFDAALRSCVEEMAERVPPDAGDLPGWAVALFDFHGARPEPLRVAMWAQLEHAPSAEEPLPTYLAKARLLPESLPVAAIDMLVLVYAMAQAWYLTPVGLREADGARHDDPARLAAHREALRLAVARIVTPDP